MSDQKTPLVAPTPADAVASAAATSSIGASSVDYSAPPPYPVSAVPASFPANTVYDPLIDLDAYVDATYPRRSGILFSKVPSGPLKPAYLPANADGSKTFFYCVTVGLKVGIVTDASIAAEYTNGVSSAFKKKCHSHSAALKYFNEDLANGKVRIGKYRKSSRDRLVWCVIV
ncbi:hypothetical protein BDZ89DRAFT_1147319 [Hymenopellis radicata]|nr:hypothetical protein BDZ89DRAFT_1147319 [Hymenopellis radicata]